MTISEVSDSDLSKWIAEKLEPLSSLPNPDTCDKQDMDDFPTECWLATFELSLITLMQVPCWSSRDMVNDAQMTLMLLEKLVQKLDAVCIAKFGYYADYPETNIDVANLGRAIAESWALANGWKSE